MTTKTARRDRWRWRVAGWADRLPGQCWADLVSWALRTPDYRLIVGTRRRLMCWEDPERRCYCGKATRQIDPPSTPAPAGTA